MLPTLDDLRRLHGPARRAALEVLYLHFNRAEFRASDPVEFVWSFPERADREVAAWAAAALAYGRVASIRAALADLNRRWENQPAAFVFQASVPEQRAALRGFTHRWTRDTHLLGLLGAWRAGGPEIPQQLRGRPDARAALGALLPALRSAAPEDPGHLLPDPRAGSACKRLAMWLRWMVRSDAIDPGLWSAELSPAQLWVPLDTHMFRISGLLGLTRRRQPDGEAARRITAAYARICPEDPVRYDFALTRLGMGTQGDDEKTVILEEPGK